MPWVGPSLLDAPRVPAYPRGMKPVKKTVKKAVKARETLGQVDVTSGTLLVFDFGLIEAFAASGSAKAAASAALAQGKTIVPVQGYVNAVMVRGITPGCYPVWCERLADGDFPGLRGTVTLDFASKGRRAARIVELGEIPVDCARIGFFDLDAIDHWNHAHAVDGLADTVFWGRDEKQIAERFKAPELDDGTFGFVDLPFDEALALADQMDELRKQGELRFAFDFRPHTDAYVMLAQFRKNANAAGVVEVGGHVVCGFNTTWGDGYFPATLELDAADKPLRCVIRFATERNIQAMKDVNGM